MPLTHALLTQMPVDRHAVVQPILADLARGVGEDAARAHLSLLARLPGVTVEGWAPELAGAPLKFSYRLCVGTEVAYLRRQRASCHYGPWQLTRHPYTG